MDHPQQSMEFDAAVGLCLRCVHSRKIASPRGSVFFLCELSTADPRFAKYPRLPVLRCEGYEQRQGPPREES
jgi:hypothetical protein